MKHPLFSKTLQGILLLLLPRLLKKCGLEFSDAETQSLVELVCDCLGGAWATYGRFKAEEPLRNPLASDKLPGAPLCVLLSACCFSLTGCAALDTLTPAQQGVLKATAKAALQFGLAELGERVKEVRPYQEQLQTLVDVTFAEADRTEATNASAGKNTPRAAAAAAVLGAELRAGVARIVPDPALRAQVLAALRDALLHGAPSTRSARSNEHAERVPGAPQKEFNAAVATKL